MRLRYLYFIISVSALFASCERDDICAESTPTTPLLIIRFYDADNPTEFKAVTNLGVVEDGDTNGLLFNTDSIAIPLRTEIDETRFQFVINATAADEDNPTNEDIINFNYTRTEDYISKACGFRVTYDGLQEARAAQDDGFWIQDLIISNTTIDNETAAHIRIFH